MRKNITREDVIINSTNKLDGNWKEKINDPKSEFLASWRDDVTKKITYMRPERGSSVVSQNNRDKFENARSVGRKIDFIWKKINELKKGDIKDKQLFCCIFLIYDFGIRNGSHDLGNDVIGAS